VKNAEPGSSASGVADDDGMEVASSSVNWLLFVGWRDDEDEAEDDDVVEDETEELLAVVEDIEETIEELLEVVDVVETEEVDVLGVDTEVTGAELVVVTGVLEVVVDLVTA